MSNNSLMPTRRTIIRTAAWTAPAVSLVVAAPAFAVSGTQCVITGTRKGANFFATITCGLSTISTVHIGSTAATFNGVSYEAKLSGTDSDVQLVTVVTSSGTYRESVTFVPVV